MYVCMYNSYFLHQTNALNHWSTEKMIALMNKYWWWNINKAAKSTHLTCPICLNYNPRKPVSAAPGHFELPKGPLEIWEMDFIQLPPSRGYKYISVIVCMFSHWTEAFPCRQATASVAKILLEKIIPTWGAPLELYSNRGTHFTGQVLWQICAIWPVYNSFIVFIVLNFQG